ncbi:MAG: L,D-transpeptidase [Clostridia bacterium]|nr:L,D-transpeptidase [Clostridia bacterium]
MIRKIKRILAAVLALVLVNCCAAAEDTYFIEVDITNQIVTVYHNDVRSEAGIVRQMICSTGANDCTPTGHFKLNQRNNAERTEWYAIPKYDCYVQYVTRIIDAYLFHSLPYHDNDYDTLDQEAAAQLGEPASHGCIRLRPEDAKWIAKNCPNGTRVHIYHSNERDEFLRDLLLDKTYSIDGEWFSYADYLGSAGGLTAAVEAMITREKIEGTVLEVTPMPEAE